MTPQWFLLYISLLSMAPPCSHTPELTTKLKWDQPVAVVTTALVTVLLSPASICHNVSNFVFHCWHQNTNTSHSAAPTSWKPMINWHFTPKALLPICIYLKCHYHYHNLMMHYYLCHAILTLLHNLYQGAARLHPNSVTSMSITLIESHANTLSTHSSITQEKCLHLRKKYKIRLDRLICTITVTNLIDGVPENAGEEEGALELNHGLMAEDSSYGKVLMLWEQELRTMLLTREY